MEWLARYTEFVTADTIIMAANYMKELFSAADNQDAENDYIAFQHTSESIPSVI